MAEAGIMAAVSLIGAGLQYKQQRDAAKEQKAAGRRAEGLAEENAKLMEAEAAREAGVLEEQHAESAGRRRAIAAASGVAGGTQDLFLARQAEKEAEDVEYLKTTGESRAAITRSGGANARLTAEAQARGTKAGAIGSLIGGISGAVGAYQQYSSTAAPKSIIKSAETKSLYSASKGLYTK